LEGLFAWEFELVRLHVHAAATESNTFSVQPQALFYSGITAKLDFATRSKHSLPGQAEAAM